MKKWHQAGVALIATVVLSATAWAGAGPAGHKDEKFSTGEPGSTKSPARTVLITTREGDGKMMFIPDHVKVRRGEQIKFVIRNNGDLEHEFVLGTTAENLRHAKAMMKNPGMEHDDPNATSIEPKKVQELVWKFTKAGTFEYACLIPGHREAGMIGTIVVK